MKNQLAVTFLTLNLGAMRRNAFFFQVAFTRKSIAVTCLAAAEAVRFRRRSLRASAAPRSATRLSFTVQHSQDSLTQCPASHLLVSRQVSPKCRSEMLIEVTLPQPSLAASFRRASTHRSSRPSTPTSPSTSTPSSGMFSTSPAREVCFFVTEKPVLCLQSKLTACLHVGSRNRRSRLHGRM